MKTTTVGKYELLRKIAAGGMAELFVARERGAAGFHRDVVIKRLFAHLAHNEDVVRMFQLEAKLMAELSHPGIPQIYDLGQADGTWFIAMEYVDGETLADVWRAGAKLGRVMPMPVSVAIAAQACEALHHAHERSDRAGNPLQIVHRDVTPQNIMVTRDGVVKLLDFGVAQSAADATPEASGPKGTYSYMAPEQVRCTPLDRRADIFALGVVLYELTTGTRLYRGSEVEVITAIAEKDAPLPSTRAKDYPADLSRLVMGALSRDAADRPPTAAHLAADLERFAMHNGWPMGLRAVASYVQNVCPRIPVPDPSAALVVADHAADDGLGGDTMVDEVTAPEGSTVAPLPSPDPLQSSDLGSQADWPTPAVFDFAIVPRDISSIPSGSRGRGESEDR